MKPLRYRIKWPLNIAVLTLFTLILISCAPPNSPPAISSLDIKKVRVSPAGNSNVECVATDADGDTLTYTWSSTGGTLSGTGKVITWTAPDVPGTYAIKVIVNDGRRGEAARQITVDVPANKPPVITGLTAEPPSVVQGKTCTITCTASDPDGDELTYRWSPAKGTISGQGPSITWTAPTVCGDYAVSVTVSDSNGGEASDNVTINVVKQG